MKTQTRTVVIFNNRILKNEKIQHPCGLESTAVYLMWTYLLFVGSCCCMCPWLHSLFLQRSIVCVSIKARRISLQVYSFRCYLL